MLLKLCGEVLMDPVSFGDHEQSGSVFIQTVYDPRTDRPSDAGKIGAVMEKGVHQGAAPMTGCRVNDHTGGLVHHQKVRVFIKDIEGDGLRDGGRRLGRRQMDRDLLAHLQPPGGLGGLTVEEDGLLVDEPLNLMPRGELFRFQQKKVKSLAVLRSGDDHTDERNGFHVQPAFLLRRTPPQTADQDEERGFRRRGARPAESGQVASMLRACFASSRICSTSSPGPEKVLSSRIHSRNWTRIDSP